jgi:hypothetical protein
MSWTLSLKADNQMTNSRTTKHRLMLDLLIQRDAFRKRKFTFLAPKDERLLEIVGLAYVRQERLSLKDLMSKVELGSPAFIHSRMKELFEA